MQAVGRSVCTSWVPSQVFVASARWAIPPGSVSPEVSERRTQTEPVARPVPSAVAASAPSTLGQSQGAR